MITWITERLFDLIGVAENRANLKRELSDNALRALSVALTETCLYFASQSSDREREEMLAKYWSAAAIPIRHIDPELASMCEHKARYWINPEYWRGNDKLEAGIKLDRLQQLYLEMLEGKA